jgi:hypothetical protein
MLSWKARCRLASHATDEQELLGSDDYHRAPTCTRGSEQVNASMPETLIEDKISLAELLALVAHQEAASVSFH